MTTLDATGLSVLLGGVRVLDGADVRVGAGQMVGLVGPNGSGKTTLLRAAYRARRPDQGRVRVDGDDVWAMRARQVARRVAVLAQERATDFDLSVAELVALGRIPHKSALARDDESDDQIVLQALDRVRMLGFAGRLFASLSGGERQKALLARCLAQQPDVLVLDEPTNHLDVRAQLDLLALVRSLGTTTIAALHDLNLAATFCDRVAVLHGGAVHAFGPPADVLDEDLLARVFGVRAHRVSHPVTGRPQLLFDPTPEPSKEPVS